MQTAAAYLWVGQYQRQMLLDNQGSKRHAGVSRNSVPTSMSKRGVTEMTRTLFLYRLMACTASLLVLVFSTLPQLVLVVAKTPEDNSIDRLWGWCHSLVYFDHATRCFATYLIVVPFAIFFWDFFFSEVVPMRHLVVKQIFRMIVISTIPIALFSLVAAIPLLIIRYVKGFDGTDVVCYPLPEGTSYFLAFDFAVTRVLPAVIIVSVGLAFLLWLPRRDYGVLYEPMTFLLLLVPVVLMESTVYVCYRLGKIHVLINKHFANILHISYAIYHMSFSSTFVLATLRAVVAEIREERRRRAQLLLEDELHLEDHIKSRVPSTELSKAEDGVLEMGELDEEKPPDDVTLHYSILRRSATIKSAQGGPPASPVMQNSRAQQTRKNQAQSVTITNPLAVFEQPPLSPRSTRSRQRPTPHGTPRLQSREIVDRMGNLQRHGTSADQYLLPSTPSKR
ncbi:unnamed protein product [Dibothriocephalus latus]|uniref:Uncharacterized protein n=1 Tax=Dibothriocephalus latus TaxID=60516 RepID=A0A3P7KXC4_DIBLA|nr:unnamed protein product [Dibothriocephalus latus]